MFNDHFGVGWVGGLCCFGVNYNLSQIHVFGSIFFKIWVCYFFHIRQVVLLVVIVCRCRPHPPTPSPPPPPTPPPPSPHQHCKVRQVTGKNNRLSILVVGCGNEIGATCWSNIDARIIPIVTKDRANVTAHFFDSETKHFPNEFLCILKTGYNKKIRRNCGFD